MTVAQLAQESQDRRRITWLLVAFIVLLVLTLTWGISRIERSRTAATESRLADQGWNDVRVEFSGRDATLSGAAPPGVDPDEIAQFVDEIWGVRRVSSEVTASGVAPGGETAPETLIPALVLISVSTPEDDPTRPTVVLSGTVPSSVVVDAAVAEAADAFGAANVTNQLAVGPVEDAAWLNKVWATLGVLVGSGQVDVTIGAAEAVLTGIVFSDAAVTDIETAIGAAVAPELRVVNELTVSATVEPLVAISVSDGRVLLEGRAPPEAVDAALTSATGAFGQGMVDNELFAGNVAGADWLGSLWQMMPLFARAGSLDVTVDGSAVRVEGSIPSLAVMEEITTNMEALADRAGMIVTNDLRFDLVAAAAACPEDELNSLLDAGVSFGSASDDLTTQGRNDLDGVAALLQECEGVPVEVAGHTDSNGSDRFNLDLSERRAQAVVDYLIEQGVDADRLEAVGYGEAQPIADNSTVEGRAQNRRIELRVGGSS